MEKSVLLFFAGLLILSSCVEISYQQKSEFSKLPKQQRIEALAQQEFELTKDPYSLTVPKERLYEAKQKLVQSTTNNRTLNLSWDERGPDNFAGRVRAILFDAKDPTGNTIWAGGVAGGLWKCTNAFDNYVWEEIQSFQGNVAVSCIIQDPLDPNIMYLGTGEGWYNADAYRGDGIYKSLDGGLNWFKLNSTSTENFQYIQKLIIVENRLFACTRGGGLQISIDGGESWSKSLGNGQFGFSERAADIELASNGILYAAMGISSEDGIYKSEDNGDSWTYLPLPFSGQERIEIAVAPSNPNVIYGITEDAENGAAKNLIKSTDGGESWVEIESPSAFNMNNFARNQAWYDLSLGVDPVNENRVYIGGVDLLLSEDGAQTWTQISQWYGAENFQYVHADQHALSFLDSDPSKIMFSNDGGIWLTSNGNSSLPSISDINTGFNITQFYSCAIHPNLNEEWIIGGTQDNGTHLFTSVGINSTQRILGGDGSYVHIDKDNPDIQIGSYIYNSYWITTDGWETNNYYQTDKRQGYFINPTDYDDVNDKLYASAENGELNIVDVYTGKFDSILFSELGNERITAIKVNPFNSNQVYIGTNGGDIYRIENLLTNAEITELYSGLGSVRSIEFDNKDESRLVASFSNYGVISVLYSKGDDNTWQNIEGNLPDIPVRWAIFNPVDTDGIILATELGIWSTGKIAGTSTIWSLNSENLPLTRVDMLDLREEDDFLVAATHGRGMYTSSSLSKLAAFFEESLVIRSEGDGNIVDEFCNSYRLDSIALKINQINTNDLDFELEISENGTAIEGVDFELNNSIVTIEAGQKQAWVYLTIYDDMIVGEDRKVTIIASNQSLNLQDSCSLNIIENDIPLVDTDLEIKNGLSQILSSASFPGAELVFSEHDSLILSVSVNEESQSSCFQAGLIYSSTENLEVDDYEASGKLFYIESDGQESNTTCQLVYTNTELQRVLSISDTIKLLYTPILLSNFDDIAWQSFDDEIKNVKFGFNENRIEIDYKGPGTYALGTVYNLTPTEEFDLDDVIIYPNPVSDKLHIDMADDNSFTAILYDVNGRSITSVKNQNIIDVSNVGQGIYILEIKCRSKENFIIKKIIID